MKMAFLKSLAILLLIQSLYGAKAQAQEQAILPSESQQSQVISQPSSAMVLTPSTQTGSVESMPILPDAPTTTAAAAVQVVPDSTLEKPPVIEQAHPVDILSPAQTQPVQTTEVTAAKETKSNLTQNPGPITQMQSSEPVDDPTEDAPQARPSRSNLVILKSKAPQKISSDDKENTGFSLSVLYSNLSDIKYKQTVLSTGQQSTNNSISSMSELGARADFLGHLNKSLGIDLGLAYISDLNSSDNASTNKLAIGIFDINLVGFISNSFFIYAGPNVTYFFPSSTDHTTYTAEVGGQAGLGFYISKHAKIQLAYNVIRTSYQDYTYQSDLQIGGFAASIGYTF